MAQGSFRGGLSGSRARSAVARFVLGAAIGVALVAGCATEPDPVPERTVEPMTAPPAPEPSTEQPTAEALAEPEAPLPLSGTPNEHDAQMAAEYFVELHQYVLSTGDSDTWSSRSQPTCGFCAIVADEAEELRSADAVAVGLEIQPEATRFIQLDEELLVYAVEVEYTSTEADVIDSAGEVVSSFAAQHGYLVLEVGYVAGRGWLLFTANESKDPLP